MWESVLNAHKSVTNIDVVIAIGSNIEQHQNITRSLDALAKQYTTLKCSPVYKSFAKTNNTDKEKRIYYNLVASFNTNEGVLECKKSLRKIEESLGRKRHHDEVSCDLDLLLYGDECTTIANVQIPHDDIDNCDYVLRPLADLLPEKLHPQKKQSFKTLWDNFSEKSELEPIDFKWRNELLSIQPTCLSL